MDFQSFSQGSGAFHVLRRELRARSTVEPWRFSCTSLHQRTPGRGAANFGSVMFCAPGKTTATRRLDLSGSSGSGVCAPQHVQDSPFFPVPTPVYCNTGSRSFPKLSDSEQLPVLRIGV